jgi:hypothetical protein
MAQPNKALQGVLLVILILGGHLPGSFYIDRRHDGRSHRQRLPRQRAAAREAALTSAD